MWWWENGFQWKWKREASRERHRLDEQAFWIIAAVWHRPWNVWGITVFKTMLFWGADRLKVGVLRLYQTSAEFSNALEQPSHTIFSIFHVDNYDDIKKGKYPIQSVSATMLLFRCEMNDLAGRFDVTQRVRVRKWDLEVHVYREFSIWLIVHLNFERKPRSLWFWRILFILCTVFTYKRFFCASTDANLL